MDYNNIKRKLKEFAEKLSQEEREEFVEFLDSIPEVFSFSLAIKKMEQGKNESLPKERPDYFESELKEILNLFENKTKFPTNQFLVDFITYYFRPIIGQSSLERRSRKEIANKFYSKFRNKYPKGSFSALRKKIESALSQNAYNDLFEALIRHK